MIVTRSWLQEYIDLSDIDNDTLYKTFNSIGLEVDSFTEHKIPAKVVVGEILACEKHPDADKLNVCQVNTGSETVQIVCGAKNVVNAKYVAVATVGAVLPGDFKIKKAKLRGQESFGMICSSTELGIPELEDGIMILDDSIGELVVGKELNSYEKFADTVIELELTANRGDCQSVHGVARDLCAAFKKEIKSFDYEPKNKSIIGIAKQLNVSAKCDFPGLLDYSIATIEELNTTFLERLRLAFVDAKKDTVIDDKLAYATHESGVVLRAYDYDKLHNGEDSLVHLTIEKSSDFVVEVKSADAILSTVGVEQNDEFKADDSSKTILLEASYIDPDFVVEGVSANKLKSDDLYYIASRGSEPDVTYGLKLLQKTLNEASSVEFSSSCVSIGEPLKRRKIALNVDELIAVIGQDISRTEVASILTSLGFEMDRVDDNSYRVSVPLHCHDIKNIQDIAEEVMRIYGIDNIESKAMVFEEKNRINSTYLAFKAKRDIRQRASSASFYEAVTYTFANKELLTKYGFEVLDESLELLNPIVNELNTMRTTILVNLLEAASRNVKYGKKSIALFELGTVFNCKREESQRASFIYSGLESRASVVNFAKAKKIDFATFVEKLGSVIGEFSLESCEAENGLMHPFVSASIIKDGVKIGFVSKLHPEVAKDFDLDDTFIAEVELEPIMPKHINAKPLSNFQAVTKDLSILVDKELSFYEVSKALNGVKEQEALLKDFYPLDIYSDEKLGDKKSLTVRFDIQSDIATLSDEEIESVMSKILSTLEEKVGATIR